MRKDELIAENRQLKKDLSEVCEHHLRLTKILDAKIDEIWKLKKHLTKIKKADKSWQRGQKAPDDNKESLMKIGKEGKKCKKN